MGRLIDPNDGRADRLLEPQEAALGLRDKLVLLGIICVLVIFGICMAGCGSVELMPDMDGGAGAGGSAGSDAGNAGSGGGSAGAVAARGGSGGHAGVIGAAGAAGGATGAGGTAGAPATCTAAFTLDACHAEGVAVMTAEFWCSDLGSTAPNGDRGTGWGTCGADGLLSGYYAGLPCPFDVGIANTPGWTGPCSGCLDGTVVTNAGGSTSAAWRNSVDALYCCDGSTVKKLDRCR